MTTKLVPPRVPCSCGKDHSQAKHCPHRGRHWFTIYGHVGLRRPNCVACGAPNPDWDTDKQTEWDHYASGRFEVSYRIGSLETDLVGSRRAHSSVLFEVLREAQLRSQERGTQRTWVRPFYRDTFGDKSMLGDPIAVYENGVMVATEILANVNEARTL